MNVQKSIQIALLTLGLFSGNVSCDNVSISEVDEMDTFKVYKENQTANKKLVVEFVEAMRTSNVSKLKTMIADDFSWWIIGKPDYLATAGEHDSKYFLDFFKGTALFPDGADFKTTSMISEGNTVAAEAEFKAKTAMGTQYENYYHILFVIENGKIKRMKEYMDTYHAKITFGL
ncbi:MAG: nuclear transport factor 2 family protein [Flavobacteriales bacterium]|jgi:ketosteroid isomerase-like protein|nr:nuclear transport factor 2 family protein [Flavobacteriales bacterium]